jgi:stress-induced morphogen
MMFQGPMTNKISAKLTAALSPKHLEVLNESHTHNVPKNSETHFKIICVSDAFEGKKLTETHRMVNHLLEDELKNGGIHALSLVLRTPQQWIASQTVPDSPACRGGSKN